MGRIKSIAVKSLGDEIIEEHGDKLTSEFGKNKAKIKELREIKSKRVRNVVAGYVTKELRKKK